MVATRNLSVLLADNEAAARDQLWHLIVSRKDLSLDGVASSITEIENFLLNRVFDLLIIDAQLFFAAPAELLNNCRELKMQIVTGPEKKNILEVYERGAVACLAKPVVEEKFHKAIERAKLYYEGISHVGHFFQDVIYTNINANNLMLETLQTKNRLKDQHAHICLLILKGNTQEELCRNLSITSNTLKSYLREIYAKTIEKDKNFASSSKSKLYQLSGYLQKMHNCLASSYSSQR